MAFALREATIADSWFRTWDARWKFVAVLLMSLAVALLQQLLLLGIAAVLALLLLLLARVPWRELLLRLSVVGLGIAAPLLVLPFTADNGLERGLVIASRAITIALLGLFVLHTTPFIVLLAALQQLKVPGVLLQIGQLAYRYTFEFFNLFRKVRMAMFCRGFRLQTNTRSYRSMGEALGSLVIRGGTQSEQVADAMLARGFTGRFHTLTVFHTRPADVLVCVLLTGFATVLLLCEWLT